MVCRCSGVQPASRAGNSIASSRAAWASGWQTLRRLSAVDERLDPARLDTLLERARQQQERIEEWRVRQA